MEAHTQPEESEYASTAMPLQNGGPLLHSVCGGSWRAYMCKVDLKDTLITVRYPPQIQAAPTIHMESNTRPCHLAVALRLHEDPQTTNRGFTLIRLKVYRRHSNSRSQPTNLISGHTPNYLSTNPPAILNKPGEINPHAESEYRILRNDDRLENNDHEPTTSTLLVPEYTAHSRTPTRQREYPCRQPNQDWSDWNLSSTVSHES